MLFSIRLGALDHFKQDYIDELVKALKDSGNCFDEVWLASSYGLLSIEQCEESAKFMGITAGKFKEAGIVPSMQVSRTIGHGAGSLVTQGKEGIKGLDVNYISSINGEECIGNFCWNNKEFRDYIANSIKAYVAFKPHIVWVDDDLRPIWHGKSRALCFCENCIGLFNEKYGYNYVLNTLRDDFYKDRKIREEYIEFQTETLKEFAQIISKAVNDVSPESIMALQNGGNTMLSVNAHKACLDAMKEATGLNPGFRAGGGVYNDHTPGMILNKAIQLNYMTSRLPEYVSLRSCEIENLPFISYGKSHEGTCLEATLDIAYGCNMASVTLMNANEPLSYHKELFKKLTVYKDYLKRLVESNENTDNAGICIYQPIKSYIAYHSDEKKEAWLDTSVLEAKQLFRCGMPFQATPSGNVYFLSSKACDYICEEDVEFLLDKNVITDAASLEKIFKLGYADKFNADIEKLNDRYQGLTYEKTTEHCINHGIPFEKWSDSSWYSKDVSYCIKGDLVESVSNYYSYETGENLGSANAVIKTAYDAKWFIRGAHLCNGGISHNRRNQIVNALNYINAEALPAYVESAHQIAVIPRVNKNGETVSITLLNESITECKNVKISVCKPAGTKCVITDPYKADVDMDVISEGSRSTVTVDSIEPWKTKILYFN